MPYADYEKQKENARQNYWKNRDKKLKRSREYYYENWEKKQEQRKAWIEKNKEKHQKWLNNYYKKYRKVKNHAQQKVFRALQTGKLKRINICEVCKKKKSEHAHHEDYSKPLEVLWVCRGCHVQIHKEKKND